MRFVNREKELGILESEYKRDTASFVVVYGRRRIGKTRLIEEFLSKKKEQIYYLAADEKDLLQIRELKSLLGNFFSDEFLIRNEFKDWKELFLYLQRIWPKDKKIIFAVDEASFIIKNNASFSSYLQQFWDKFLSKTKTMLILSGSLVGLMLKDVLSGGSPLYGRRTAEIFLEQFEISHIKWFLNKPIEETIKFFSVLGGVPKYLEIVGKESFNEFIEKILDKRSFFYREGIYLMTEEFKDISSYSNILKAISEGNTKLNEIANYTGIEGKKISAYLDILENIGFIESSAPVIEKKEKFRGKIYLINDSFLDFWFRFINKNRSLIEMDKKHELMEIMRNELNSFIGKKFERACLQFLTLSEKFRFTKIGKQWGKFREEKGKNIYEIDIVALNEKAKEILFAECKWQDKVDAEKIAKNMLEKSNYVEWPSNGEKEKRKEHFAVFAKSFSKKIKELNGKPVYCFDLQDLEKILTQIS